MKKILLLFFCSIISLFTNSYAVDNDNVVEVLIPVGGINISDYGEHYEVLFLLRVTQDSHLLRPKFVSIVNVCPQATLTCMSTLGSPSYDISNCIRSAHASIDDSKTIITGGFSFDFSSYISNFLLKDRAIGDYWYIVSAHPTI